MQRIRYYGKCSDCNKLLRKRVSKRCVPCFRKNVDTSGKYSYAWKGGKVGYSGLHNWVKRHLGRPAKCEHCGKDGLSGHQIHWANKSHEYKRELTDWIRLCRRCHRIYDKKYTNVMCIISACNRLRGSREFCSQHYGRFVLNDVTPSQFWLDELNPSDIKYLRDNTKVPVDIKTPM